MKELLDKLKENWIIIMFFCSIIVGVGTLISDVRHLRSNFINLLSRFVHHLEEHNRFHNEYHERDFKKDK